MECSCIKPCEECTCCFEDDIEIDVFVPMPPKKEWKVTAKIVKVEKGTPNVKDESS